MGRTGWSTGVHRTTKTPAPVDLEGAAYVCLSHVNTYCSDTFYQPPGMLCQSVCCCVGGSSFIGNCFGHGDGLGEPGAFLNNTVETGVRPKKAKPSRARVSMVLRAIDMKPTRIVRFHHLLSDKLRCVGSDRSTAAMPVSVVLLQARPGGPRRCKAPAATAAPLEPTACPGQGAWSLEPKLPASSGAYPGDDMRRSETHVDRPKFVCRQGRVGRRGCMYKDTTIAKYFYVYIQTRNYTIGVCAGDRSH